MASHSALYHHIVELLGTGNLPWGTDTLKLALLDSSYAFNAEHVAFADVAAAEISGTGYTSGGFALSNLTRPRTAGVVLLSADALTITGLTATFRSGVVYADATRGGVVQPLLKYLLFDASPADIVLAGEDYPLQWPGGLVRLAVS
jgi:hypothetical protein